MLARMADAVTRIERRARKSFGMRIDTPWQRALSHVHLQLIDHAFLRVWWRNFHQVAPGVWRANQPSPHRIRTWKRMGFAAVLNLRGETPFAHYLFEREACEQVGLPLYDLRIWARKLPPREKLIELIEIFERIERPFVMHCKSGADRTGLAAALYLVLFEGRPLEEARRQLSWKYLHAKSDATGVLDHFFEEYAKAQAANGIGLREWIETEYDPVAVTESFRAARAARSGLLARLQGRA